MGWVESGSGVESWLKYKGKWHSAPPFPLDSSLPTPLQGQDRPSPPPSRTQGAQGLREQQGKAAGVYLLHRWAAVEKLQGGPGPIRGVLEPYPRRGGGGRVQGLPGPSLPESREQAKVKPWCNRLWLTVAAGSVLRKGVRKNRLLGGPQGQATLLY